MKRFLQILFTAAALALMIFTKAAVMVTAPGPEIRVRSFYSYFTRSPSATQCSRPSSRRSSPAFC